MSTRPEPTEEELRAAWRRCRRDTWPDTFEEAMQDPTRSRLVRLNALHPPRAHRTPPPAPARAQITKPSRAPLPGVAPGYFDRKRAAAGERDDD